MAPLNKNKGQDIYEMNPIVLLIIVVNYKYSKNMLKALALGMFITIVCYTLHSIRYVPIYT